MYSMDATMTQQMPPETLGRLYEHASIPSGCTTVINGACQMFVEIIEQPVSNGPKFRYKCEGRSAGCIRGVNSTEKQKTYPTIKVHGYRGAACVVVSCVTKDGPPYYPHPHNLVGKTCTNGVCYKTINNPEMVCSFSNLGIQCVKRKEVRDALAQREALQVDPFGTGFSHSSEPIKINLNALRLCFQVFIPDSNGKLCVPLPPVISTPINKTASDLTITKLSHCSAPVTGGQEIILLCNEVNKDDIQIIFYEEIDKEVTWSALGKFSPHHVHRKAAISFQTPAYKNPDIQQQIHCFIHLRRPSDGAIGKSRAFTLLPLRRDPEGMARKRNKFEALRLDRILQLTNLPSENSVDVNSPRIIKQAVRSKPNYHNSAMNQFHSTYVPGTEYSSSISITMMGNASYNENVPLPIYNPQKSVLQAGATSTVTSQIAHQKVDDILAAASEEIGLNNAQNFCETPVDDTLDNKLSSLDLGPNCSDLDVNLSGIILDSFSDSAGLSFSLGLSDGKFTEEKMQFQDNVRLLQDRGSCT